MFEILGCARTHGKKLSQTFFSVVSSVGIHTNFQCSQSIVTGCLLVYDLDPGDSRANS